MRSKARTGLYDMTGPAGYSAVSGFFFTDDAATIIDLEDAAIVHQDELTMSGSWSEQIWNDSGSGARDDGASWAVDTVSDWDPNFAIIRMPEDKPSARFFHGFSGYDKPLSPVRILDIAKCKILMNSWLFS